MFYIYMCHQLIAANNSSHVNTQGTINDIVVVPPPPLLLVAGNARTGDSSLKDVWSVLLSSISLSHPWLVTFLRSVCSENQQVNRSDTSNPAGFKATKGQRDDQATQPFINSSEGQQGAQPTATHAKESR